MSVIYTSENLSRGVAELYMLCKGHSNEKHSLYSEMQTLTKPRCLVELRVRPTRAAVAARQYEFEVPRCRTSQLTWMFSACTGSHVD